MRDRLTILILAVLVSMLYMLPNLFFILDPGNDYQGLSLPVGYDQETYFAMIREIYDGNYGLESPYIWEEKHGQRDHPEFISYSQIQWLPIYVSGYIGKLLHLDIGTLDVVLKGVFPPLIFLLLYALGRSLNAAPLPSMLAALMGTLMPQIWSGVGWIFPTWVSWNHHLIFMRPVVSQVAVLPWLGTLYFFARGVQANNLKYTVASGVLLGLVFYCYMFYWIYTYCVLGLFAVVAFLLRDRAKVKHAVIIVCTSVLVSIPVWIQYIQSLRHLSADPEQGFTLYGDRTPYVSEFQFAIILFVFVLIKAYRSGWIDKTRTGLLAALSGAHILCMNQQVILGKGMEISHYEMFISPVIFSVVLVSFLSIIGSNNEAVATLSQALQTPRWKQLKRYGLLVLLVGLLAAVGVWYSGNLFEGTKGGIVGSAFRAYGRSSGILFSILIASCIAVWGIRQLLQNPKKAWLVLACVVLWGVGNQVRTYSAAIDMGIWKQAQSVMPAFRWLNEHTEKESVVLGNFSATAMWVPIYTHDNVYTAAYAKVTTSSASAFHQRTLRYLAFIGMGEHELRTLLDSRLPNYNRGLQIIFFGWSQFEKRGRPKVQFHGLNVPSLTDGDIDGVIEKYRQVLALDPMDALQKYKVDYVFDGPFEHEGDYRYRRSLADYGNLRMVYEDSVSIIYRVEKQ